MSTAASTSPASSSRPIEAEDPAVRGAVLIGHVAELWRYPVKSMQGEQCESLMIGARGIEGDRRLAFESTLAPVGKPLLHSGERSAMLRFRAAQTTSGDVLVFAPDGQRFAADDPVLRDRLQADALTAGTLALRRDSQPFTDVRPIALHTRATEQALAHDVSSPHAAARFDPRRLRSNVILELLTPEAFAEDRLSGKVVQLGNHARLEVLERIPRCRMVALDPETAQLDRSILQMLARRHEGRAGVYARTLFPGSIRIGDPVYVEQEDKEEDQLPQAR